MKYFFVFVGFYLTIFHVDKYAIAGNSCDNMHGLHQEMTSCIQKETAKYESEIKNQLSSKVSDYNFSKDFYNKQRLSIHEKCMLYSNVGGQRGELLTLQCELDSVKEFGKYISQYIEDIDNS
ncbi:MAG: hypothetical protein ACRC53_02105 [Plesiomonas sp.]|uniref:hypothetical protein n=1 Tax=Plesiomonas sp. TaxID=2486279 RepID=UPI003F35A302